MEINELKIELLKRILACKDIPTLEKINDFFAEENIVSEVEEEYRTEEKTSELSPEQWEELNRRHKEYLEGKGESYSWEQVKEKIRQKYDL